jgi:hypothetical protein
MQPSAFGHTSSLHTRASYRPRLVDTHPVAPPPRAADIVLDTPTHREVGVLRA